MAQCFPQGIRHRIRRLKVKETKIKSTGHKVVGRLKGRSNLGKGAGWRHF